MEISYDGTRGKHTVDLWISDPLRPDHRARFDRRPAGTLDVPKLKEGLVAEPAHTNGSRPVSTWAANVGEEGTG